MAVARDIAIALSSIVLFVGVVGGYIYLFGIPPQVKKYLEEEAFESMGESQAKDMLKNAASKIPASDQEDVQEIRNAAKKGLGGDLGGAKEGFAKNLQNPLGKLGS